MARSAQVAPGQGEAPTLEGVVEANNRDEAVASLKEQGLIVSSIEETPTRDHDIDLRLGGRRAKDKSLAIMCRQFSIILQAGMPVVRTMQLVAEQTDDKTLKQVLLDVADDVAAGFSLADSFEKHADNLPVTFVESVRAGEESGSLDTVFERLSKYYTKQARSKDKVKSALIYPAFVLGVAVVVVAIIMVVAVPVFKSTFEGMGIDLPWPTLLLMGTSDFFSRWGLVIAGVVVGFVIANKLLQRYNEDYHLWVARRQLRRPAMGRIRWMSAAAQYSSTMSMMMAAGLSVVRSVGITARTMDSFFVAHGLETILPDLEAGKSLGDCLARIDVLPHLVTDMTGVGEQTGAMEHTLDVLGDYYDNEVETATERMLSIMEPVMIVVLAVIVFLILLAVYMPMFSLYGSM